jgi:hypothetical protein
VGKKHAPKIKRTNPTTFYCCDSDSLINLRDAKLLQNLRQLAQIGALKIAKGVYKEIHRKTDRLFQTLKQWHDKYSIIVELDQRALTLLPDLETKYGQPFKIGSKQYNGFWASSSGRRAVDAQIIALAKTHNWVVVSNDDSVHGACMLENVVCCRWEELGRILHPEQLKLL